VLGGSGQGNLRYRTIGSADSASFAQVINNQLSSASHYRTIINGFDLGHLSARDPNHPGPATECPFDSASVVTAVTAQLDAAFGWLLCADFAGYPLCITPPCDGGSWPFEDCVSEVPSEPQSEVFVNRLERNRPNPFNPRTTIRFSLAESGTARLVVYDAGGRKVKTLVDGAQTAGVHEVVWDGTNDSGSPVASGVYWSQLHVKGFTSNKKLVVLK
jgi:hypothetical protein